MAKMAAKWQTPYLRAFSPTKIYPFSDNPYWILSYEVLSVMWSLFFFYGSSPPRCANPLCKPMRTQFPDTYLQHWTLGLRELMPGEDHPQKINNYQPLVSHCACLMSISHHSRRLLHSSNLLAAEMVVWHIFFNWLVVRAVWLVDANIDWDILT